MHRPKCVIVLTSRCMAWSGMVSQGGVRHGAVRSGLVRHGKVKKLTPKWCRLFCCAFCFPSLRGWRGVCKTWRTWPRTGSNFVRNGCDEFSKFVVLGIDILYTMMYNKNQESKHTNKTEMQNVQQRNHCSGMGNCPN